MGLTSDAFVWGATAVAVLAFAGLVAAWRPLARPRWWLYPVRALALLVVVNLALLSAFGWMNQQNLWYASWHDLVSPRLDGEEHELGAKPQDAAAQAVGDWAPARGAAAYDATPLERTTAAFQAADGGRWTQTSVKGTASGHTGDVLVWLPASYFTPEGAGRTYPVLTFLHGVPGVPRGVLTEFRLPQMVTSAVQAGHLRESIIVVPGMTPGGVDTECVDSRTMRMETWLAADVPAWVTAHLRVERGRASWAVGGFSGGGYCAAMLSVKHPDVYAAAIVMATYFRPDFGRTYRPFGPGDPEWSSYDLVERVRANPPALAMWIQSSEADGKTLKDSREFTAAVRSPLAVENVVLKSAGHRNKVWRDVTPQALQWLGETAPGFRPTAP